MYAFSAISAKTVESLHWTLWHVSGKKKCTLPHSLRSYLPLLIFRRGKKKTPDRKLVTTWYELLSLITTSLSLSERRAGKCKLSQAIMLSCQSMRLNLNWHLNIEFGWAFLRRLGGSGPGWKGREGNGWELKKWPRGVGMGAAGMGRRSASAPLLLSSLFSPLSFRFLRPILYTRACSQAKRFFCPQTGFASTEFDCSREFPAQTFSNMLRIPERSVKGS